MKKREETNCNTYPIKATRGTKGTIEKWKKAGRKKRKRKRDSSETVEDGFAVVTSLGSDQHVRL